MSGESTVGFSVAGGDPARLYDAARWHDLVADDFDGHAAVIDHTAGSLSGVWQGDAASSYQGLSREVAAHFRTAADRSRSASATVRRYARELERYQQEGRHCLAEAEHWQQQVTTDKAKLVQAEKTLRAAEAAVTEAQRQVRAAASAGATAPLMQSAAAAALAHAQGSLAAAQAADNAARRALEHAEDELHHWQARGQRVLQEAKEAGSHASTTLTSLSVPPPPRAATPASPGTGSPTPAVSTVAASALAGSASPGGSGAGAPAGTGTPGTGSPVSASAASAGAPPGAGTTAGGPNLSAVNSGARQGAVTFGDLEKIGRRFGWNHSELEAWWQVISDESGGNPAATNPSSGAFGIGQFLGGTYNAYLPYGAGSSNPLDQLNAMAQYIHNRYGNPLAALAHENGYHWY